ncbi:MAG: FeoA family protein [Heliobacteriaceae bacterium]|nr:FeoA family protein [Heliobacteriaceae bacterium]MDD4587539.1 FeoA family protein [Heliobacteriaceae bacterium]
MTLANAPKGQIIRIVNIRQPLFRSRALGLGLFEGETVVLQEAIPAGPVVIRKNQRELAVGRRLAEDIDVVLVSLEGANRS